MEKAHPEIQDFFLQIFDRGEARDAKGRVVDFRPYIFIIACNISREKKLSGPIGFTAQHNEEIPVEKNVADGLSRYFRREFLARISSIIEFVALQSSDYFALLEKRLINMNQEMTAEHECVLKMTETAKTQFVNYCIIQPNGCRGFNRLFDQLIALPARERAALRRVARIEIDRFENHEPLFASSDT
jgi:ATP-dependent Clp protease ATP-binding subunit ClpA